MIGGFRVIFVARAFSDMGFAIARVCPFAVAMGKGCNRAGFHRTAEGAFMAFLAGLGAGGLLRRGPLTPTMGAGLGDDLCLCLAAHGARVGHDAVRLAGCGRCDGSGVPGVVACGVDFYCFFCMTNGTGILCTAGRAARCRSLNCSGIPAMVLCFYMAGVS